MKAVFLNAFARLADICWPRICAVADCGRKVDRPGRHICSRCYAQLPWFESGGGACRLCGSPVAADAPHAFVCDACRQLKPAFARARAALHYAPPADGLVKAFKFHAAFHLADDFADLLEAAARARLEAHTVDVVVPVPLHPARRRTRGYNQSAILARALAKRLDRRYDGHALRRRWDTACQSHLPNRKARLENIRAAFEVNHPSLVRGRHVLLVDDVMTTGATLHACAVALARAQAAEISCLALARA